MVQSSITSSERSMVSSFQAIKLWPDCHPMPAAGCLCSKHVLLQEFDSKYHADAKQHTGHAKAITIRQLGQYGLKQTEHAKAITRRQLGQYGLKQTGHAKAITRRQLGQYGLKQTEHAKAITRRQLGQYGLKTCQPDRGCKPQTPI
eukprot:1157881-Pelagomonas_calceolata.AAC.1